MTFLHYSVCCGVCCSPLQGVTGTLFAAPCATPVKSEQSSAADVNPRKAQVQTSLNKREGDELIV